MRTRSWSAGLPSGQPRRRLVAGALAFFPPLHGVSSTRKYPGQMRTVVNRLHDIHECHKLPNRTLAHSHAHARIARQASHAGTHKYNRETRRCSTAGSLRRRAPLPSHTRPAAHPKDPRLSGGGRRRTLLGQRADGRAAHESTEGVLAATSTRRRAQMRNQKRQLKHGQSTKRMSITSLPALIGRSHESAR